MFLESAGTKGASATLLLGDARPFRPFRPLRFVSNRNRTENRTNQGTMREDTQSRAKKHKVIRKIKHPPTHPPHPTPPLSRQRWRSRLWPSWRCCRRTAALWRRTDFAQAAPRTTWTRRRGARGEVGGGRGRLDGAGRGSDITYPQRSPPSLLLLQSLLLLLSLLKLLPGTNNRTTADTRAHSNQNLWTRKPCIPPCLNAVFGFDCCIPPYNSCY